MPPAQTYSEQSRKEEQSRMDDARRLWLAQEEARRQLLAQQEAQEAMRLADWDGQERRRREQEQASTAPVGPWSSIGTQALPGLTPEWVPRAPPTRHPRQWKVPPPNLMPIQDPFMGRGPMPGPTPSNLVPVQDPLMWRGPMPGPTSPWTDSTSPFMLRGPGRPIWRGRPTHRNNLLAR